MGEGDKKGQSRVLTVDDSRGVRVTSVKGKD